jgi:hypothetical protein
MQRTPDTETRNPTVKEITDLLMKATRMIPLKRGAALPKDPTNTCEIEHLKALIQNFHYVNPTIRSGTHNPETECVR